MFSLVRFSVMVSAQTLSFRKEMLTKYVIMGDYVTRDIAKSSLSVLTGVRTKLANFRENM